MNDPAETIKMLRESHGEYLVPGIKEDKIPTSEPGDNMYVHVIPDDGEIVRPNENLEKSSEFTYHKKDANTDTSSCDRVLNELKKVYTSYNPTMIRIHEPVIEGNYKVTGDTRVIPIVEQKYYKIQWACSTSISTGAGEPETLKEAMTRPNWYL